MLLTTLNLYNRLARGQVVFGDYFRINSDVQVQSPRSRASRREMFILLTTLNL